MIEILLTSVLSVTVGIFLGIALALDYTKGDH